ncbi:autotransporter outer membrane beta-barrel domain-containing protein [Chlamydiifrater phoenicopteri]|uniref:autotransporter outer membrane beta-barrel domain-containing protein n=1 Tax=Chlamydiifrater phoenicopteri TaxID=2681469 RepID=UPI001BCDDB2C|nr:autotransporter outer membrane beta-barrel domain-containing protein [Chlamydiifrater phoenicopteri]
MPFSIKRFSSVYALGMFCSFQAFGDPLPLSEQKFPLYVTGDGNFFLSENTTILNVDASLSSTALLGASGNLSIDGRDRSLFINGCQGAQSGVPLILAGNPPSAAQQRQQQQQPASTSLLISLTNFHTFSFLNNSSFSSEGTISAGRILWNNNKNIIISKNTSIATQSPGGGAAAATAETSSTSPSEGTVKAKESIVITNTSDTVYFSENSSNYGGAIRMEEKSSEQTEENLSTNGVTLISNNPGSVTFDGNKASSSGGAIFGGSLFFTSNKGSIQFLKNSCIGSPNTEALLGSGGAVSLPKGLAAFQGNSGAIVFNKNTATGDGGAIYAETFQASGNTGTMLFADNSASKKGGAIRAKIVSIDADSNVIFSNNKATEDGGAIFVDSIPSSEAAAPATTTTNGITLPDPSLSLFAKSGNIVFIGNTGKSGTRNAIALGNSASLKKLSANAGYTIAFYDPITEAIQEPPAPVTTNTGTTPTLTFNEGTSGKILFSGKFAPRTPPTESLTRELSLANEKDVQSKINAAVTLAGGILEITDGASLEVSSFTQSGGHLVLGSGSTLKASSPSTLTKVFIDLSSFPKTDSSPAHIDFSTPQNAITTLETDAKLLFSEKNPISTQEIAPSLPSTLESTEHPSGSAATLDMPLEGDRPSTLESMHPEHPEGGIATLEATDSTHESAVLTQPTPRTFSVSGVSVVDTEGSNYYDKAWETPHTVEVLKVSGTTTPEINGEFGEAQTRSGSDYGYHGTWTFSDGSETALQRNGNEKTISAKWAPSGTFFLPYNRRGEIVANTLWSTLSTVDAFATTAYESPFEAYEGKRLVAEGIGSFLVGKTEKDSERDGFRFEGGGYGVCFGSSRNGFSSGIALGQIFGKTRSKLYHAKSTENAFLGSFYAAAPIRFLFRELETIASFVLGYGFVENTLKTEYPENSVFTAMKTSTGKWDNRGAILRIRFTNRLPEKHFNSITPFSGLRQLAFFFGPELSGVRQSSFTERGAPARAFERGKGFIISLPVGFAYQAHFHVGNNATHIRTSCMYKPDIYRDNPHIRLVLIENSREYRVDGAQLARNAFRLDAQGATKLSNHYEFTAGYSFEGRSSVFMHRASVTLGKIF